MSINILRISQLVYVISFSGAIGENGIVCYF